MHAGLLRLITTTGLILIERAGRACKHTDGEEGGLRRFGLWLAVLKSPLLLHPTVYSHLAFFLRHLTVLLD